MNHLDPTGICFDVHRWFEDRNPRLQKLGEDFQVRDALHRLDFVQGVFVQPLQNTLLVVDQVHHGTIHSTRGIVGQQVPIHLRFRDQFQLVTRIVVVVVIAKVGRQQHVVEIVPDRIVGDWNKIHVVLSAIDFYQPRTIGRDDQFGVCDPPSNVQCVQALFEVLVDGGKEEIAVSGTRFVVVIEQPGGIINLATHSIDLAAAIAISIRLILPCH
mmetsp:Transcript_14786/g.41214  ORF Transcript_14786/g.41214 Transcript_14786/m.41214 type:complete len:214 (+) Transcript_14786:2240-2881(+)